MRTIDKGTAPACLTDAVAHAETHGYDWQNLSSGCKEDVRQALHAEQRALCAYCSRRIQPASFHRISAPSGTKIEHHAPRSLHAERMFDWDNLLAVCGGQEHVGDDVVSTCDTARGNAPLNVHPALPSPPTPERVFEFRRHPPEDQEPPFPGVWIHGKTPEAQSDIDVLNLNAEHLVRRRRDAQAQIAQRLASAGGNANRIRSILNGAWLACTEGDERGLTEYAPMLRSYILQRSPELTPSCSSELPPRDRSAGRHPPRATGIPPSPPPARSGAPFAPSKLGPAGTRSLPCLRLRGLGRRPARGACSPVA